MLSDSLGLIPSSSTFDGMGQTTELWFDLSEPVPPSELLINANSLLLKGNNGY